MQRQTRRHDAADQLTRLAYTTTGGHVLEDVRHAHDAAGQLIVKMSSDIQSPPATEVLDARSSFK